MHNPLELAEALMLAGEMEDALLALSEQLADAPDDAETRRLRARLLISLRRGGEALADLDALSAPTAHDHLLRAQAYALAGDADGLRNAALAAPENAEAVELVLRDLFGRGESEAGLALLAGRDKTWRWLGWSGDFAALRGEYAAAVEQYGAALDDLKRQARNAIREMQKAYLLLKRAEIYRKLRRFDEADADYRAAEAIVPNDPMISFNRGLLAFDAGSLRKALPLCRDALDHAPDALRDAMRQTLLGEPRYEMLAQALLS